MVAPQGVGRAWEQLEYSARSVPSPPGVARHAGMRLARLVVHAETRHSVELVAGGRFGYLLKDRAFDVDAFLDALRRVADGGSALDTEVVARLLAPHQDNDRLAGLTPREREVLAHVAEGRTNAAIAQRIWLTERTIEAHVSSIMNKLGLYEGDGYHRRVLAVLTYLGTVDAASLIGNRRA